MSRNKFGELVRKYVIDRSGDAERMVLGQLPGNYVGMNVYEALNMMLNILFDKDDMGIAGATDKVAKVCGVCQEQAEEIVCAHKKYREKYFPKDCCTLPEYEEFRKKVNDLCESLPSFRRSFVSKENKCIDTIVREINYQIVRYHSFYGVGLDGTHSAIKELERYINKINKDAGSFLSSDDIAKYVGPLVLYHPYYGNHKNVKAHPLFLVKKESVMNSSKKSRGHDKYRFFINKPGTESEDIGRVLSEAEKEGYDLVAVNNTNTNNPPFIYGTAAVVKALDNKNCCVFDTARPFETKTRKGWYIINTKLTIGEVFEAVKKANENRTKVVVERYRVLGTKKG